jgi:perosamine synthetase
MKYIPVFDIKIGNKEKKYVNLCLKNSWLGQGHFVEKFEKRLSKFVKVKFSVSTSSGTTALHLACASIGLKEGDEVLVSSSTNMASVFSIIYCGAKPIPVDISKENWQLKVEDLKKKITNKTKAIMVVHLFGHAVDMDPIKKIAKKFNLRIIEDCAEALGVKYKGKNVGSIGDVAAFSFYSNKTITSGEGGMITTNSKKIFEKAQKLRNLAYGKKNKFQHELIGFNYRLPNISAAIGLAQLENIQNIFKQKKRIYERYKKNLKNVKGINIPKIEKWTSKYIMWVFNIYLDNKFPISRDELQKKLYKLNIETRNAFVPANQQNTLIKKYTSFKLFKCPEADYIMTNGLYLPSGNTITNNEIDRVCSEIKKITKNEANV